ncbi:putative T7SS-secreted protein [Streptomyces rectiviolaceus]|uniref:Putative T7SS secretion signal domain-containing protein n=1 Tax=Streptomyces rectiviolaceus TaxID=332591 RepID=A0ABP6M7S1_9ACTN
MTYAPGQETPRRSASSHQGTLDDLTKPQGLKSAPHIPNPTYPALGFNPVPGSPDTVRSLHKKLANCAKVLDDTHGQVTKLMAGSYWEGDAAVAFREQIDGGPLPLNLKNAAHSLTKAAKQLCRWHDELDEFQRRAKLLNEDAKDARAAVEAAQGRVSEVPDGADDRKAALKRATGKVDEAQAELDRILGKARRLASEHEEKAGYRARKIRDATRKLAPKEPGLFEEIGEWLTENLPDILSFVAGVVGLVALFVVTGGVAAAVLLLVAGALSAGAVGLRVSDPAVQASLWDGVTKCELDSDFWGNAVGVTSDVVGMAPGLSAIVKGGAGAVRSLSAGAEAVTLGQRLTTVGTKTVDEARAISRLGNPFLDFTVRGASDAEKAGRVVEVTSSSLGVATAGYGLAVSAAEALDNDTATGGTTGVDGVRLGLDSGGLIDLARHAFP